MDRQTQDWSTLIFLGLIFTPTSYPFLKTTIMWPLENKKTGEIFAVVLNCQDYLTIDFVSLSKWLANRDQNQLQVQPLDGSLADTLGLDNHPVLKLRFEADTANHLRVRFTDLSYFRPETCRWRFSDGKSWNGTTDALAYLAQNGSYKGLPYRRQWEQLWHPPADELTRANAIREQKWY